MTLRDLHVVSCLRQSRATRSSSQRRVLWICLLHGLLAVMVEANVLLDIAQGFPRLAYCHRLEFTRRDHPGIH